MDESKPRIDSQGRSHDEQGFGFVHQVEGIFDHVSRYTLAKEHNVGLEPRRITANTARDFEIRIGGVSQVGVAVWRIAVEPRVESRIQQFESALEFVTVFEVTTLETSDFGERAV
jgi:hypothetical protein